MSAPAHQGRALQVLPDRLRYLSGLDGLRALAVLAVLVYHGDYAWLPGGFLGVDVFFVLSGYLITALLIAEWRGSGRIALGAFWLRRARRLLPALMLLLGGLLGYAVLAAPGELAPLRGDTVAAVGYMTNWWLVFHEQSYFESMSRPPLLQHLWSLAVEGQFYLLWPLIFVLLMRLFGRGLPFVLVAASVASAALMAVLYDSGAGESRVYYGTDTRAAGLLLGAALASAWHPGDASAPQAEGSRRSRVAVEGMGAVALALLGVLVWRLDEFHPLLYRGGFLLVAVASATAIAAVASPRARVLPAVLGAPPLRWLGTRSYAVYLWHWPVFLLTRPHLDVPMDGLPLFAVRLAITFTLAELSYRLVETPVRHGSLGAAWAHLRRRRDDGAGGLDRRRPGWIAAGALGTATVVAMGIVSMSAPGIGAAGQLAAADALHTPLSSAPVVSSVNGEHAPASPAATATEAPAGAGGSSAPEVTIPEVLQTAAPDDQSAPASVWRPVWTDGGSTSPFPASTASASSQVSDGSEGSAGDHDGESGPAAPSGTAPSTEPSPTPAGSEGPDATASPSPTAPADPPPSVSVTALGDSVMLGAVAALEQAMPGIYIEGEVGLQAAAAVKRLQALRTNGQLGDVVVIHIGTNGIIRDSEFEAMMDLLTDVPRVVVVNVKVPRPWEDPNNRMLAGSVADYPNAVLIDWHGTAAEQGDYFWTDGIHLRPEGASVYASMIAAQATPR